MPVTKEKNKNILDNLAENFRSPWESIVKCALRPKARGEGLMINKERLSEIDDHLYKVSSEISELCTREALNDLGVDKYGYWWMYEKQNPDGLSDEEMAKLQKEYYALSSDCEKREKMNTTPFCEDDAYCLAVGEKLKHEKSGSLMPLNILWGIQNSYLSKEKQREAESFGEVLNEVWKKGKYTFKEEDPRRIPSYGIFASERDIGANMNKRLNAVARKVLK